MLFVGAQAGLLCAARKDGLTVTLRRPTIQGWLEIAGIGLDLCSVRSIGMGRFNRGGYAVSTLLV